RGGPPPRSPAPGGGGGRAPFPGPPAEPDLIEEFDTRERSEPDPNAGTWQAVASDAILGEVIDTYAPSDGGLFALDGLLSPEQERALLARDAKIRAEQARRIASAPRASKASREAEERQARRNEAGAFQSPGGTHISTPPHPPG
ncbi:putative RNA helicase, partial [Cutibacterium acnes]